MNPVGRHTTPCPVSGDAIVGDWVSCATVTPVDEVPGAAPGIAARARPGACARGATRRPRRDRAKA